MHTRYTSALRINSANVEDLEKNLDCYQKAFDEVFFFSQFTHSVKSLSYHQKQANILYVIKLKRICLEERKKVMVKFQMFCL